MNISYKIIKNIKNFNNFCNLFIKYKGVFLKFKGYQLNKNIQSAFESGKFQKIQNINHL